jgi:hypothetical protein
MAALPTPPNSSRRRERAARLCAVALGALLAVAVAALLLVLIGADRTDRSARPASDQTRAKPAKRQSTAPKDWPPPTALVFGRLDTAPDVEPRRSSTRHLAAWPASPQAGRRREIDTDTYSTRAHERWRRSEAAWSPHLANTRATPIPPRRAPFPAPSTAARPVIAEPSTHPQSGSWSGRAARATPTPLETTAPRWRCRSGGSERGRRRLFVCQAPAPQLAEQPSAVGDRALSQLVHLGSLVGQDRGACNASNATVTPKSRTAPSPDYAGISLDRLRSVLPFVQLMSVDRDRRGACNPDTR